MKKYILKALVLMMMAFLLPSCTDDSDRPLTRTEQKQLDSVLVDHRKEWQVYYDSICTIKMDSMIQFYFDSLIQKEYEDIKKLER